MIFINCIFAFLTAPEIKKLLKFICKFFKTSHYWELFVVVFVLGKLGCMDQGFQGQGQQI